MNVRPLQDRILVRRVEEAEKTRGGIIIPDSAKERPLEGKVIAVGSGKRLEDGTLVKLDVKEGDKVRFVLGNSERGPAAREIEKVAQ